ncbi:hypothetical protein GCM10027052_08980 [Parafrigoribacterium mesophilum]|uniref:hypothetical protein n=1 Tax=Parafrigoribacterium mesophilum TaxID=433646 RepID=UPI0031FDC77B
MEQLLYILPALACPVGMGLMMWFMMRGHGKPQTGTPAQEKELADLRAQVEALRAQPTPFTERHPAPAAAKNLSA